MSGRRKVTLHGANTIIEANKSAKSTVTVFDRLGSDRGAEPSRKVRHASPTLRKSGAAAASEVEPCRMWEMTGDCPYGNNCKNAHPDRGQHTAPFFVDSEKDVAGADRIINIDIEARPAGDSGWMRKTMTISNEDASHRVTTARSRSPSVQKRKHYASTGGDDNLLDSSSGGGSSSNSSRRNTADGKMRSNQDDAPDAKRRRQLGYEDAGRAEARRASDDGKASRYPDIDPYKVDRLERTISTKSSRSEESSSRSHSDRHSSSSSSHHHSHHDSHSSSRTSDISPHDAHSSRSRHTHDSSSSSAYHTGSTSGGSSSVGHSTSARHEGGGHHERSSHRSEKTSSSGSHHSSSRSSAAEYADRHSSSSSSRHSSSADTHHRSRHESYDSQRSSERLPPGSRHYERERSDSSRSRPELTRERSESGKERSERGRDRSAKGDHSSHHPRDPSDSEARRDRSQPSRDQSDSGRERSSSGRDRRSHGDSSRGGSGVGDEEPRHGRSSSSHHVSVHSQDKHHDARHYEAPRPEKSSSCVVSTSARESSSRHDSKKSKDVESKETASSEEVSENQSTQDVEVIDPKDEEDNSETDETASSSSAASEVGSEAPERGSALETPVSVSDAGLEGSRTSSALPSAVSSPAPTDSCAASVSGDGDVSVEDGAEDGEGIADVIEPLDRLEADDADGMGADMESQISDTISVLPDSPLTDFTEPMDEGTSKASYVASRARRTGFPAANVLKNMKKVSVDVRKMMDDDLIRLMGADNVAEWRRRTLNDGELFDEFSDSSWPSPKVEPAADISEDMPQENRVSEDAEEMLETELSPPSPEPAASEPSLFEDWSENEDEDLLSILYAPGPIDLDDPVEVTDTQVTDAAASSEAGEGPLYEDMDEDEDLNAILQADEANADTKDESLAETELPTASRSVEEVDWSVLAQDGQQPPATTSSSPDKCLERFTTAAIFESCGVSLSLAGSSLFECVLQATNRHEEPLTAKVNDRTSTLGALFQKRFESAQCVGNGGSVQLGMQLWQADGFALTARKDLDIRRHLKAASDSKLVLGQSASAIPGDGVYLRPSLDLYLQRSVANPGDLAKPTIVPSVVGSILVP